MQSLLDNKALMLGAGLLALVAGIGLLLAIVQMLYRGRLRLPGGRTRQARLGIVDAFDLDRQRQLIIVRRDNTEHLIMIGGPNDLVIESEISRVDSREIRREKYEPAMPVVAGYSEPRIPVPLPPADRAEPMPPLGPGAMVQVNPAAAPPRVPLAAAPKPAAAPPAPAPPAQAAPPPSLPPAAPSPQVIPSPPVAPPPAAPPPEAPARRASTFPLPPRRPPPEVRPAPSPEPSTPSAGAQVPLPPSAAPARSPVLPAGPPPSSVPAPPAAEAPAPRPSQQFLRPLPPRPPKVPPPRPEPAPPAAAKSGETNNDTLESLEEEMAKLLGRGAGES